MKDPVVVLFRLVISNWWLPIKKNYKCLDYKRMEFLNASNQ